MTDVESVQSPLTKHYWNQHLWWDFVFALSIFSAIELAGKYWHLTKWFSSLLDGNRSSLYGAILSVDGTLLGFVITAATFCAGFIDHKAFTDLKKAGDFYDVFAIYRQAALALGCGLILSLISLIADTDKHPNMWISMSNVFMLILLIFRVYKSMWVVKWLAQIQMKKSDVQLQIPLVTHVEE